MKRPTRKNGNQIGNENNDASSAADAPDESATEHKIVLTVETQTYQSAVALKAASDMPAITCSAHITERPHYLLNHNERQILHN